MYYDKIHLKFPDGFSISSPTGEISPTVRLDPIVGATLGPKRNHACSLWLGFSQTQWTFLDSWSPDLKSGKKVRNLVTVIADRKYMKVRAHLLTFPSRTKKSCRIQEESDVSDLTELMPLNTVHEKKFNENVQLLNPSLRIKLISKQLRRPCYSR